MIAFAAASEADFERLLALRVLVMRPHLERIGRFHPERARARFREAFDPAHMRLILVYCTRLSGHKVGVKRPA